MHLGAVVADAPSALTPATAYCAHNVTQPKFTKFSQQAPALKGQLLQTHSASPPAVSVPSPTMALSAGALVVGLPKLNDQQSISAGVTLSAAASAATEDLYWDHMLERHNGSMPACLTPQRSKGWAKWHRKRPQLVVLAGVEGSGHHVLLSFFDALAKANASSWAVQTEVSHFMTRDDVPSITTPDALWEKFPWPTDATTHPMRIVQTSSHPMGQPRSANRFVDLHEVDALYGAGGSGHADVRHIFLVRDAKGFLVADSVHREFASLVTQSRILELDVAYLDSAFRTLPCGRSLLLPYELLVSHPTTAGRMIAKLLDADAHEREELTSTLQRVVEDSGQGVTENLPHGIEAFWARRQGMYPAILGGRFQPPKWEGKYEAVPDAAAPPFCSTSDMQEALEDYVPLTVGVALADCRSVMVKVTAHGDTRLEWRMTDTDCRCLKALPENVAQSFNCRLFDRTNQTVAEKYKDCTTQLIPEPVEPDITPAPAPIVVPVTAAPAPALVPVTEAPAPIAPATEAPAPAPSAPAPSAAPDSITVAPAPSTPAPSAAPVQHVEHIPAFHIVAYAHKCCELMLENLKKRADEVGAASMTALDLETLEAPEDFKSFIADPEGHGAVCENPERCTAGFWVWKPWVLLQMIRSPKIKNGEVIIYIDATAYPSSTEKIRPYVQLVNQMSFVAAKIDSPKVRYANEWTKMEAVDAVFGHRSTDEWCNNDKGGKEMAFMSGIIGVRKDRIAREIAMKWRDMMAPKYYTHFDDSISVPQCPQFQESRYEQMMLQLMLHKHYRSVAYHAPSSETLRLDYGFVWHDTSICGGNMYRCDQFLAVAILNNQSTCMYGLNAVGVSC